MKRVYFILFIFLAFMLFVSKITFALTTNSITMVKSYEIGSLIHKGNPPYTDDPYSYNSTNYLKFDRLIDDPGISSNAMKTGYYFYMKDNNGKTYIVACINHAKRLPDGAITKPDFNIITKQDDKTYSLALAMGFIETSGLANNDDGFYKALGLSKSQVNITSDRQDMIQKLIYHYYENESVNDKVIIHAKRMMDEMMKQYNNNINTSFDLEFKATANDRGTLSIKYNGFIPKQFDANAYNGTSNIDVYDTRIQWTGNAIVMQNGRIINQGDFVSKDSPIDVSDIKGNAEFTIKDNQNYLMNNSIKGASYNTRIKTINGEDIQDVLTSYASFTNLEAKLSISNNSPINPSNPTNPTDLNKQDNSNSITNPIILNSIVTNDIPKTGSNLLVISLLFSVCTLTIITKMLYKR